MSHVRCFRWLGGVPELVFQTSEKRTSRACRYDPDVIRTISRCLSIICGSDTARPRNKR
ncbi:hypothetical protein PROSTU_00679 [Providencia stuartii ATCC 25827]|uniref:Uncharacterized protein n=1 Tax=Providencia stuartii ATCC 25827 TaxID=471874 RepID=A0AA86YZM1_PROST|nr:hypothetical protein PROSTU_00679 [Providencia stuartii ATCC 25827]